MNHHLIVCIPNLAKLHCKCKYIFLSNFIYRIWVFFSHFASITSHAFYKVLLHNNHHLHLLFAKVPDHYITMLCVYSQHWYDCEKTKSEKKSETKIMNTRNSLWLFLSRFKECDFLLKFPSGSINNTLNGLETGWDLFQRLFAFLTG